MGYAGKLPERERARVLRAAGLTMPEIATRLGVSRSSVSLWTRDVAFTATPRHRGRAARPNPLQVARLAEIDALDRAGRLRLGELSDQAFLAAGAALYAGEGSKREGMVQFANSDPSMIAFFCRWLRACFVLDEQRFRMRVYLHAGLDVDRAQGYWSSLAGIPAEQFYPPYRPVARTTRRTAKHEYGCAYVLYLDTHVHRAVMGLVRGLLQSLPDIPG